MVNFKKNFVKVKCKRFITLTCCAGNRRVSGSCCCKQLSAVFCPAEETNGPSASKTEYMAGCRLCSCVRWPSFDPFLRTQGEMDMLVVWPRFSLIFGMLLGPYCWWTGFIHSELIVI